MQVDDTRVIKFYENKMISEIYVHFHAEIRKFIWNFHTPWRRQKTRYFLTFSGGIETWNQMSDFHTKTPVNPWNHSVFKNFADQKILKKCDDFSLFVTIGNTNIISWDQAFNSKVRLLKVQVIN